mmetsp:Transcript_96101/g.206170  ORF Transcript_96101/g.206170 Transcript_96101/m.206170 type:complete len:92 (+) Transcript_96101:611-886(+)
MRFHVGDYVPNRIQQDWLLGAGGEDSVLIWGFPFKPEMGFARDKIAVVACVDPSGQISTEKHFCVDVVTTICPEFHVAPQVNAKCPWAQFL